MAKLAVVLFNLGGPDRPEAVEPFLFNLFKDPAIIGLPAVLRWPLARLISRRRAPVAREIYARIGGRSPLLELTRAQAVELEKALGGEPAAKVFVAMRYWHPFSKETVAEVSRYDPDRILLLPLYPQFSTTTTGSSLADWHRAAGKAGFSKPTTTICCYPTDDGLIAAHAERLSQALDEGGAAENRCVLFSAHGLPRKIVAGGDPYQWQVEQTAAAIAAVAGLTEDSWRVCYQSRVGRLEWIGPSLDAALESAAAKGAAVYVVPISFVSEHSETLVELDMEYRDKAAVLGIRRYVRIPAPGNHAAFISGLARLVNRAPGEVVRLQSGLGGRQCPANWSACPCRETASR